MISGKEMLNIEANAIDDYINTKIANSQYKNEVIDGDLQVWTDADKYYEVPGICTVDSETIKEWLVDSFDSVISEFLRLSGGAEYISDLAEDSDLIDAETFYDFVYDTCDDIEEYFWSSDVFENLKDNYFEEHGEEIQPGDY